VRSKLLLLAFIAIAVVAVFLTASTYDRFLESHAAVGDFNMRFLHLEGGEDPATFHIEIELINASDAPMEIRAITTSLYHDGRLIATRQSIPEDFTVPARGERSFAPELTSNLGADSLPGAEEVANSPDWSVRVSLDLSHKYRSGTVMLRGNRTLHR